MKLRRRGVEEGGETYQAEAPSWTGSEEVSIDMAMAVLPHIGRLAAWVPGTTWWCGADDSAGVSVKPLEM